MAGSAPLFEIRSRGGIDAFALLLGATGIRAVPESPGQHAADEARAQRHFAAEGGVAVVVIDGLCALHRLRRLAGVGRTANTFPGLGQRSLVLHELLLALLFRGVAQ